MISNFVNIDHTRDFASFVSLRADQLKVRCGSGPFETGKYVASNSNRNCTLHELFNRHQNGKNWHVLKQKIQPILRLLVALITISERRESNQRNPNSVNVYQ